MDKNNCCLCGGKIRAGRCVDCGMPLQKTTANLIDEKEKEKKIRKTGEVDLFPEERAEKKKTKKEKVKKVQKVQSVQKETIAAKKNDRKKSAADKKAKKAVRWIVLIPILFSFMGSIAGIVGSFLFDTDSSGTYVESTYDSDPYEWVSEEFVTGDQFWSGVLEPGFYEVGVHIPAGEYTVSCYEGSGFIRAVKKDIDLDYYSDYLTSDSEEEQEGTSMFNDFRCYEGSILIIPSSLIISLESDCALVDDMMSLDNPKTDEYRFSLQPGEEQTLVVGEDIPEGIYDYSAPAGSGSISYHVESEDNSDGLEQYYYMNNSDKSVQNLYLADGMEITVLGEALFVPSQVISENWDSDFYNGIY